ncbi:hypothetical protein FQR65_LT11828 [Abscondita terminalis]|nr:hypothetical protein FQR65_LT11828 [Abscondita terminalis]
MPHNVTILSEDYHIFKTMYPKYFLSITNPLAFTINTQRESDQVSSCSSSKTTNTKMKYFVVFALIIVVAVAEPPVRRVLVARPQRQQAQFLPLPIAGPRFAKQQLPQNFQPQPTTPEPESSTSQDSEEIDPQYDSKAVQNQPNGKNNNEKLVENENEELEEGAYYLYHPSGLLQKVVYSTSNNPAKMAFNAQLQLQNVDPISEPIYTYDPRSFVFQEIQF